MKPTDAKTQDESATIEHHDDLYYYNMMDPRSGFRYDIPLLLATEPDYFSKYVYFMRIKETSPDTFEKILRWD